MSPQNKVHSFIFKTQITKEIHSVRVMVKYTPGQLTILCLSTLSCYYLFISNVDPKDVNCFAHSHPRVSTFLN